MLLLDTNALIFDALAPQRLSVSARDAVEREPAVHLACADITLWEIAMLIDKGRLAVLEDTDTFIDLVVSRRSLEVLPITPAIAAYSAKISAVSDPADRLIAATALVHGLAPCTSDAKLSRVRELQVVW